MSDASPTGRTEDPQAAAPQPRTATSASVPAWDLPTRLFHWLLVVLVLASWATFQYSEELGDPVLKWHRWTGLCVLTLLVWRVMWGLFGSSTALFASFVPAPGTLAAYTAEALRGREPKYLGHNPLGSLMIVALLGLLLVQATLGLFTVEHNDLTAGPLYLLIPEAARKTATSWHRFLFEEVTLWLIGAHIAANLIYALWRRDPVIAAMVTGRKPAAHYADASRADIAARPLLRAAALLLVSWLVVFGGIWAAGGKFLQMRLW